MIGLVDTTVRDGHQSLWSADALTTAMIAEIAPVMDRVGFHAIDFTSSTHMAMAVRTHAEDPWERIRTVRALMPETPLGFITPGMRFMAWQRAPVDVMRLALACVIRSGIRRIWVAESMNDVETDLRIAGIAKQEGAEEVLVGLVYSISPVHTDDYYASRAREIAASADVDVLNLKDPGGLLTPERVRTLVPALRAAAPALPLEVHSHCTATMAPLVYLESARLGASFVCTAVRPLANGTSQPSAEQTIANLRAEGFEVELDEDALAQMSSYFSDARRAHRATGRHAGRVRRLDLPAPAARRHDVHAAPAAARGRPREPLGGRARRDPARARGARLADHGHAALAVRRRAGVPQRDDLTALLADSRRGRQVRAGAVRPPAGRARSRCRSDRARLAQGRAAQAGGAPPRPRRGACALRRRRSATSCCCCG